MESKRFASAAAALAMGFGLSACAEEVPEPEPVVRPIKMLTIGGTTGATREYPGRLRAGQQADMAFEVSGRIVEFVYREGQRVAAGAALARLDPRDYENLLEQAQAALKNRRTYFDRIDLAHKTGAVSDQDLNDAEAQVEVAEAEARIKQKALEDTYLRAPFDGVMSRKLVEDFANVEAKQPILIFEDPAVMEIKVSVPERDLAGRRSDSESAEAATKRLRPRVIVTSMPDQEFPHLPLRAGRHHRPARHDRQGSRRPDALLRATGRDRDPRACGRRGPCRRGGRVDRGRRRDREHATRHRGPDAGRRGDGHGGTLPG
jgi:multidrug efflux pump subunit AcrA (membrane-fusion protein)